MRKRGLADVGRRTADASCVTFEYRFPPGAMFLIARPAAGLARGAETNLLCPMSATAPDMGASFPHSWGARRCDPAGAPSPSGDTIPRGARRGTAGLAVSFATYSIRLRDGKSSGNSTTENKMKGFADFAGGDQQARRGVARHGEARRGKARLCFSNGGDEFQEINWRGRARQGRARQGRAGRGVARQGDARLGKAGQGRVFQSAAVAAERT